MSAPVTGRFAPTPSGRLHLGNIACALLAYLSARSQGGRFLLRIEDLDPPRCPRRLALQAMEDLRFLGFDWDEPPLYQSDRFDVYAQALEHLEAQGALYPCFCSRAELHASAAPNAGDTQFVYAGTCARLTAAQRMERAKARRPATRVRVPDETLTFEDGLFGRVTENLARDCGDFIVRRSDGLFGYQLAVVVDDALSGVTEVVRGRDILSSTPRQIYLQRLLGLPAPRYVHIPLMLDDAGRRLAKRDGDLDLTALSRELSPQAILGMLAFSLGILEENRPADLAELTRAIDWRRVRTQDVRLRLPASLRRYAP